MQWLELAPLILYWRLRVRIPPLPLDWTYTGSTDAWSTDTALDNAGTGLIIMCPMIIMYSMCGCFCTSSTNKIHYYIPELRGLSFCDNSWFVAVHYIVLIEVPIAILANCGWTDDEQRAMTKAHLTFD